MFLRDNMCYAEDVRLMAEHPFMRDNRGKTVLITGATGLVGTALVDALMSDGGMRVVCVGRSVERARERFADYFDRDNFCFLEHDVCDPFPEGLEADYIIPLASNTHPLAYSRHPVGTMMTVLEGMRHALDLAVRTGACVLCVSTVEVYGNARGEDVMDEDYTGALTLSTARSCYTEAKRAAEALCQSYISEFGVRVCIGRLCRVYGPTMLMNDSKASSQFVLCAARGEDIVLKSSGEQLFSYIYVADAVRGLLTVLQCGECGVAYNVSASEQDMRLREFASLCAEVSGRSVIFDLPSAEERRGYSVASRAVMDNGRLMALGWRPLYVSARESIGRTVRCVIECNNKV